MKKITLLLVALMATMTMFAQVECKLAGSMPEGWTYITNNPDFPDPDFYTKDPMGLKIRFEGIGVQSPKLKPQDKVTVNININALNENTKTSNAPEGTKVFTVIGLDATGKEVGTTGVDANKVGEVTAELNGTAIVQVKVIMTKYAVSAAGKCCNMNLGGLTISGELDGATAVENVEADKLAAFVANDVLYVNAEEGAAVRMYSVTGALVLNGVVNNGQVALNGLNNGIYVINVNNQVAKVTVR